MSSSKNLTVTEIVVKEYRTKNQENSDERGGANLESVVLDTPPPLPADPRLKENSVVMVKITNMQIVVYIFLLKYVFWKHQSKHYQK